MALNRIIPCAADYDIWSYHCAGCAAVFSMVEARLADRSSVDERRGVFRHAVAASATIELGSSSIACMVRDVSASGACLSLTSRERLPKNFVLMAGSSPLVCHAIWRRGKQAGIAFK
jgi:hypothetical protein